MAGADEPDGRVVGQTDRDDAAVLRLAELSPEGPYLVSTVDVITPVVDDPYVFGQVAAANALSDVYAMGGEPRFALAIAAFPRDRLPLEVLGGILRGGADKVREAGAAVVGGHSIADPEPKYGLAVTGMVSRERLVTQAGARAGDVLLLTKALGTGLLVGALRQEELAPDEERALVASMTRLNASAARCMAEVGATAATDVTGFGLLGHAHHLALSSGLSLELDPEALPALAGARERAAKASHGGAAGRNLTYVEPVLSGLAPDAGLRLAIDPQTSGGLLIAVAPEQAGRLALALAASGAQGARIGRVAPGEPGALRWRAGSAA